MKGKLDDIKDLYQLAGRFYISGEFKILNCFGSLIESFNCSNFDSCNIVELKPDQLPANMPFDSGVRVQHEYKYEHKKHSFRQKYEVIAKQRYGAEYDKKCIKCKYKYKCKKVNPSPKLKPIPKSRPKSTYEVITLYFNIYSGLRKINELSAVDKFERYYVCEPFVRSEKNEQFTQDGYEIYKEDIDVKIVN